MNQQWWQILLNISKFMADDTKNNIYFFLSLTFCFTASFAIGFALMNSIYKIIIIIILNILKCPSVSCDILTIITFITINTSSTFITTKTINTNTAPSTICATNTFYTFVRRFTINTKTTLPTIKAIITFETSS